MSSLINAVIAIIVAFIFLNFAMGVALAILG